MAIRLRRNVVMLEGDHDAIARYVSYQLLEGVVECVDNIFILPEGDHYELGDPDCGSVTHDRSIWTEAKSTWIDHHMEVRNGPSDRTLDAFGPVDRANAVEYARSRVSEMVKTTVDRSFQVSARTMQ